MVHVSAGRLSCLWQVHECLPWLAACGSSMRLRLLTAGEGRTLACLRVHLAALQPACKKEQLRLNAMAAADVRLRPKLQKLCGVEIATFCFAVKPGNPSASCELSGWLLVTLSAIHATQQSSRLLSGASWQGFIFTGSLQHL